MGQPALDDNGGEAINILFFGVQILRHIVHHFSGVEFIRTRLSVNGHESAGIAKFVLVVKMLTKGRQKTGRWLCVYLSACLTVLRLWDYSISVLGIRRRKEDESYLHDFAVLERIETKEDEEGRKDEMGQERMKDHPPQPKRERRTLQSC